MGFCLLSMLARSSNGLFCVSMDSDTRRLCCSIKYYYMLEARSYACVSGFRFVYGLFLLSSLLAFHKYTHIHSLFCIAHLSFPSFGACFISCVRVCAQCYEVLALSTVTLNYLALASGTKNDL